MTFCDTRFVTNKKECKATTVATVQFLTTKGVKSSQIPSIMAHCAPCIYNSALLEWGMDGEECSQIDDLTSHNIPNVTSCKGMITAMKNPELVDDTGDDMVDDMVAAIGSQFTHYGGIKIDLKKLKEVANSMGDYIRDDFGHLPGKFVSPQAGFNLPRMPWGGLERSLEECKQLCRSHAECVAFTFNTNTNNNCWLQGEYNKSVSLDDVSLDRLIISEEDYNLDLYIKSEHFPIEAPKAKRAALIAKAEEDMGIAMYELSLSPPSWRGPDKFDW